MSEVRAQRRRRSVALAPAVLDPSELPEDAEGRVSLIAVRAAPDVIDAAEAEPDVDPGRERSAWLSAGGGWVAVAGVAALFVVIFIIGFTLTR